MSSRHQQWSSSSRAGSLAAYALALRCQQQLDSSRAGSLAAGVSDRIVISSRAQPRRVTGSVRSARVVVKSEPRRVTGSVRSSLASQSLSVTCVALVTLPYRLKGSGRLVRELVREFPPHRRVVWLFGRSSRTGIQSFWFGSCWDASTSCTGERTRL